jgi:hypothetical protein
VNTPDEKAARPPLGEPPDQTTAAPVRDRRSGSLVEWLIDQGLLRGPHLFVDYWANVLHLRGIIPERLVRARLVDPALFRAGLDRPDLHVPRRRFYLLLFFLGPLLLPIRSFRRLGRYRLRILGPVALEIQAALQQYHLELTPAAPGRVHASQNGTPLARDVLDPHLVSGFCSLFWAAYKLPLACLSAILIVAVVTPIAYATGFGALITQYWLPLGFPLIVLLLYAVYRDWVTAILGALPVVFGRYLVRFADPSSVEGWFAIVLPLLAMLMLYLLFDWFFMPRPVPPVLLLYTSEGPGRPYERDRDAPYWLEGKSYWVWRYLILSPAELNKFWERDWERIDLWIRADGEAAGQLEWVVTDLHYRELWTPFDRLGPPSSLARARREAHDAVNQCKPGIWLVEVDADLVVHYPFLRGVTFLRERNGVPVRGALDLMGALWRRVQDRAGADDLLELDRARLRFGRDVLADVPEFLLRRVSRHLMAQPWRYWRYPLGAATRDEPRLYGREANDEPPPAADPALQIKAGVRTTRAQR